MEQSLILSNNTRLFEDLRGKRKLLIFNISRKKRTGNRRQKATFITDRGLKQKETNTV